MNYFNLVQVEYLQGFIFGQVTAPYWSKLNNISFSEIKVSKTPVLCRMRYYSNEKLGIK